MKDPDLHCARADADQALSDRAMDQALSWLIELQSCDEEQRARFQDWLAADPAHRDAYLKARAVWDSQAVALAAMQVRPAEPSRWRPLRRRWISMATAAVVLMGVFSFSNLSLRLQADHLTVVGERQRLQLEDGSKVLLNTDTAFSSQINEKTRVAKVLQGEAFFEVPVSHGPPLEIRAGGASMRASNGAFAVRYLDGVAQINVQRGALNVRAAKGTDAVMLAGGDSIRVGPEGFSHRRKLDQNKDLAWVQGRLVFDNCPLSEVLTELGRYYPGWIVNANSKLDSIAVTGNYRLDNPMDVVRSLAQITSARIHELPALVILN